MGLFGPKKLKEEDYYFTYHFNFDSKTQAEYSPESFTYGHSYVQYVQLMARDWFGENPITVREALKESKLLNPNEVWSPKGEGEFDLLGEPTVDQSILKSYSQFDGCERISWGDSKIAKRWQATIERKGVQVDQFPSPQDGAIEIIMGKWLLFDNFTPLPIIGEAWRNKKTGKEFVYWFIDALVRSRKLDVPFHEYPSHQFFIPESFQRIGYLSETIFPSSMIRIRDRMTEFGVTNPKEVPQVALNVVSDYYVLGLSQAEDGFNVRVDWAPEVTRYGYIIDDVIPFEKVEEIIVLLVDALPKVASILMDGYGNWNFSEQINFQSELFTDLDLNNVDDVGIHKVGLNMPGPVYSGLAWNSVLSYGLLDQLSRDEKLMQSQENVMFYRGGLFRIATQGVGAAPVHAINTLYFRIVSEDDVTGIEEPARSNIESMLEYYSHYPFDRQDANALSNLALLQSAWGKQKEALESTERGIALFNSDLAQKHVTEMSGGGKFYPIIIKWELYLTKARVLVLLNKPEKAKEPLIAMIREARAMQFSGPELADAEGLLATL